MKVIFTQSVPGVAHPGDVKNVRSGFFRNFLLPRQKAIPATEALLVAWEEKRKKILIEKEQLKTKFEEMKRRMAGNQVKIEKKVTAKGTLYGGLKPHDVVKALKDQCNIEITDGMVHFPKTVKAVGTHELLLKLGEGVEVSLNVEVTKAA